MKPAIHGQERTQTRAQARHFSEVQKVFKGLKLY